MEQLNKHIFKNILKIWFLKKCWVSFVPPAPLSPFPTLLSAGRGWALGLLNDSLVFWLLPGGPGRRQREGRGWGLGIFPRWLSPWGVPLGCLYLWLFFPFVTTFPCLFRPLCYQPWVSLLVISLYLAHTFEIVPILDRLQIILIQVCHLFPGCNWIK